MAKLTNNVESGQRALVLEGKEDIAKPFDNLFYGILVSMVAAVICLTMYGRANVTSASYGGALMVFGLLSGGMVLFLAYKLSKKGKRSEALFVQTTNKVVAISTKKVSADEAVENFKEFLARSGTRLEDVLGFATLLRDAGLSCNVDELEYLLNRVNFTPEELAVVWFDAATNGIVEIMDALWEGTDLNRFGDANLVDNELGEMSAAHLAVRHRHDDVLEFLRQIGANLNLRTKRGTPYQQILLKDRAVVSPLVKYVGIEALEAVPEPTAEDEVDSKAEIAEPVEEADSSVFEPVEPVGDFQGGSAARRESDDQVLEEVVGDPNKAPELDLELDLSDRDAEADDTTPGAVLGSSGFAAAAAAAETEDLGSEQEADAGVTVPGEIVADADKVSLGDTEGEEAAEEEVEESAESAEAEAEVEASEEIVDPVEVEEPEESAESAEAEVEAEAEVVEEPDEVEEDNSGTSKGEK